MARRKGVSVLPLLSLQSQSIDIKQLFQTIGLTSPTPNTGLNSDSPQSGFPKHCFGPDGLLGGTCSLSGLTLPEDLHFAVLALRG